jgi:hypothetical protein
MRQTDKPPQVAEPRQVLKREHLEPSNDPILSDGLPFHANRKRRVVTDSDIDKYRLHHDFSFNHWDPEFDPICLARNVFDVGYLGDWIYVEAQDCIPAPPPPPWPQIPSMAAELRDLLSSFMIKRKRCEVIAPHTRFKAIVRQSEIFSKRAIFS